MSMREMAAFALRQKCTWEKRSGIGSWGEVEFGPPLVIFCRVSYARKLIRQPDGEEVVSGAQVTTLAEVEAGDRLTIDGDQRIVLEVARPVDLSGRENRRKAFV